MIFIAKVLVKFLQKVGGGARVKPKKILRILNFTYNVNDASDIR